MTGMTTFTPLTVEQLRAMPLGACVITFGGNVLVQTDTGRWTTGCGVPFTVEYLATIDAIPFPSHLPAEGLGALPTTAESATDVVDWELVEVARPDAEVAAQTAARLGPRAASDLIDRLNGIVEYVVGQTGAAPAPATLAAVSALTDAIGEWT